MIHVKPKRKKQGFTVGIAEWQSNVDKRAPQYVVRRKFMLMPPRRDIDERDVDRILAALTDTQIAALYGMSEIEVFRLRRSRQSANVKPIARGSDKKKTDS